MMNKTYETMTVGQIVADRFSNASIFQQFGIDFCCHGGDLLAEACHKSHASPTEVLDALTTPHATQSGSGAEFRTWPLDLLSDYILKFHHRNIRRQGPAITALLDKVCRAHADRHPELLEIRTLFAGSFADLLNHLDKEEHVLFPYIYALYQAAEQGTPAPTLHCGSITAPISVMMAEHDAEGIRYRTIETLTNGYQTPSDGCASYRLLTEELKAFNAQLHEHIHLENNLVFPGAIALEQKLCCPTV